MNYKKINRAVLCALLPVSFSACNPINNVGNSQSNNHDLKHPIVGNGTDKINRVWGAVGGADGRAKNGATHILFSNISDSEVEDLGCWQSDTDMPLSVSGAKVIKPNAIPTMIKSDKFEWKSFTDVNDGLIYAPIESQDKDSMITISGDRKAHQVYSKSAVLSCVLKISNKNNKPLFVKAEFVNGDYLVSSLLFQTLDKPYIDRDTALNPNKPILQHLARIPGIAAAGVTQYNWIKYLKTSTAAQNKTAFLDFFTKVFAGEGVQASENAIKYAKIVEDILHENTRKFMLDAFDYTSYPYPKAAKLRNMWVNTSKKIMSDIDEQAKLAGIETTEFEAFKTNLQNSLFANINPTTCGNGTTLDFVMDVKFNPQTGRFKFEGVRPDGEISENIFTRYSKPSPIFSGYSQEQAEAMAKILYNQTGGNISKAANKTSLNNLANEMDKNTELFPNPEKNKLVRDIGEVLDGNKVGGNMKAQDITFLDKSSLKLAQNEVASNEGTFSLYAKDSAKVLRDAKEINSASDISASASFGAKAVAGGLGSFMTGMGVSELMNIFFAYVLRSIPSAQGAEDMVIADANLKQLTSDDVSQWNKNHPNPDEQIEDNTQVDVIGDPNSSYIQSFSVHYKDSVNDTDKQAAYTISLRVLDGPFIRLFPEGVEDPLFGDVTTMNPWGNGDAALELTIRSNLAQDNLMMQLGREALSSEMAGTNVVGGVVSAPKLVAQPTMYQLPPSTNGMLSSKNLLLANKARKLVTMKVKDPKVGDVNAYVLPTNTKLTFPLQVTSNFMDVTTSGGLIASYVPGDSNSLDLAKSINTYNNLLGAIPVIYSAYTCNFPYKYGDICNFDISLTDSTASAKNFGKVYLNDTNGGQLSLPIFIGYNLILDQKSISTDGSSPVSFVAKVASNDGYDNLKLTGLPLDAKVIKGCNGKLDQNQSCTFSIDFSKVAVGTYNIKVNGTKAGVSSTDNDVENLEVSVAMPF